MVLFVAGLFAPRKSRKLQRRFARLLRRGERKSSNKAGKLGDATQKTAKAMRRAGDKSAEAGRGLRSKIKR